MAIVCVLSVELLKEANTTLLTFAVPLLLFLQATGGTDGVPTKRPLFAELFVRTHTSHEFDAEITEGVS